MKITILYLSETGNTEKMAGYIKDGILKQNGAIDVKLMNMNDGKNIDVSFLNDSRAVIFGTPCYAANTCWQLKQFFDTRWDCKLENKLAGCFATANCMHGGADVAILTVLQHALVRGMLAYSSGTGCGRPFIHLGPIALRGALDEKKELFELYGSRFAQKAKELFE
jgi:NAD(P)H dehydrogenase (quinone)